MVRVDRFNVCLIKLMFFFKMFILLKMIFVFNVDASVTLVLFILNLMNGMIIFIMFLKLVFVESLLFLILVKIFGMGGKVLDLVLYDFVKMFRYIVR